MCYRRYLDDISQLLQRLLISGFHTLQALGFDDLLLNSRTSCFPHHLEEVLLLRVKKGNFVLLTAHTDHLFVHPFHAYVIMYVGMQQCFTCTPNRKVKARPVFPALAVLPILNKDNLENYLRSRNTLCKFDTV